MSEWSDWYAKDNPTSWVLARVLRERAEAAPDRDYLKFAGDGWLSYGRVNALSNRVANGLVARGVGRGESVSVMLPNCAAFLPQQQRIMSMSLVLFVAKKRR